MKKTNRITGVILALFLIMNTFTVVSANADDIKVIVDGQQIVFDVQPQIIDGRTMVPMRKIFEALGAVVSWDEMSKTASGKMGDIVVNVTIDSNVLFKNGVPKTLDVAPALIDGRTLVPARAIAESFDCTVDWLAETRTVKITKNEGYTQIKTSLTASEISEKVAPAVFLMVVSDEGATEVASASGFFISSDGVAVTNYHVIKDTAIGLIKTIDGDIFNVTNIIAYDSELDVAIIKVDKTSIEGKTVDGFPCVTMADSDKIKAGQIVYAIGSPDGLDNTISDGIISNVNRIVDGRSFIQTTAPIYFGSSGGALVDEYGEVLGITQGGKPEVENVGFVVPINVVKMFDVNADGMSYAEFAANNKTFTLDIYPEVIELEVGKTEEILVYAEGKGDDWSIYWDTEEDYLVNCQWGEWLEDYDHICPLNITGLREGVATITVYSDVDFKGRDITVYIRKPAIETYPDTDIPTYTAVTGVGQLDYIYMPKSGSTYYDCHCYKYSYYDKQAPQIYLDYLTNNGFIYEGEQVHDDGIQFFYKSSNGRQFDFGVSYKYNEVRVLVYINY